MESKVCHTVTSLRQELADFVQIYSEILQLKLKLFSAKRIMIMDFAFDPSRLVYILFLVKPGLSTKNLELSNW